MLLEEEGVLPGLELFLLCLHSVLAELDKRFVEVFHCDDETWAASQRFDLCCSVAQLREQRLDGCDFVCDVHVLVWVNRVERCGGELLERMDVVLNFGHLHFEALRQGLALVVQGPHTCPDHELLYFVAENLDFSLRAEVLVKSDLLPQLLILLLQSLDKLVSSLLGFLRWQRVIASQEIYSFSELF